MLWRAVGASLESCFIPNARILFVHDRSKIPYSIHRQISEVYGNKACLRQAVSNWCELFESGRSNVEDESRQGRPVSSLTDGNIQ